MRKTELLWTLLAIVAGALIACPSAGTSVKPTQPGPGRVAHKLNLVAGRPAMNTYGKGEPGTTAPRPRAYAIAPPVVPHDIADQKITRGENDCLDCHLEGEEVETGHVATKVPPSHLDGSKKSVLGMRYNCVQCHLPQTDAQPPVGQR